MKRLLSFALALVTAAACTSVARQEELDKKEQRWKEIEVESPSDRMVWQLTLLSLQTQGFPLAAGTDPGARQVETGWKTDLQPFRGEGQRRKALVRLTPLEPGRWKLEARVSVQHNQNLVSPLDAQRAEWKAAADDESTAQILLQHIRSRLSPELDLAAEPAEAKR